MSGGASTRRIVRRASSFFGYAFLWSGTISVLPQIYLLGVAPRRKYLLLSLLLLFGTGLAWLGIDRSGRQLARGWSVTRGWALGGLLAFGLPMVGVVMEVHPILLYGLLFVGFRGVSNWLFNHVDNTLVRVAGPMGAATHASAATAFQLVGHVSGAVVFAVLASSTPVVVALTVAVVAWTGWCSWDALPARARTRGEDAREPEPQALVSDGEGALSGRGTIFLAYCLLMQTGIIGLFSQLLFLLGDWLRLVEVQRSGGILITCAGVISVVTVAISTRFGRGRSPRRSGLLGAALLGLAATAVLGLWPSPACLPVFALLAGVGGGRYVLLSRTIASTWAEPGRARMLSRYNNIANSASIVSFAVIASLAALLGEQHPAHVPSILVLFAVLFAASAVVAVVMPAPGPKAVGAP